MVLFYGDSYTSGENNNMTSWVNYLELESYVNNAISGTTIGDYSLYPVKKYNLLDQLYEQEALIKQAGRIILSYGLNDISAVAAGYARLIDVEVSLIKCLDYINQINPDCTVAFVFATKNEEVVEELIRLNYNYVSRYLHLAIRKFYKKWRKTWYKLHDYITHLYQINCYYMIEDSEFFDRYLDDDNLHPGDLGYAKIAENLKAQGLF